jgi:hypothetical protein
LPDVQILLAHRVQQTSRERKSATVFAGQQSVKVLLSEHESAATQTPRTSIKNHGINDTIKNQVKRPPDSKLDWDVENPTPENRKLA